MKYGGILNEGFGEAYNMLGKSIITLREYDLKSAGIERLYSIKNSPIIIENVDGITLLFISASPSPEEACVFLLDKTIYIKPGIYFNVSPFFGRCTVKLAYLRDAAFEEIQFPEITASLGLCPKIEIKRVYTLFYQEKEQGFIFKGESHNFWELTYVDKGRLYTTIDEKGYLLDQGQAIIYGRNQHHAQWSDANASVSFVTATFDLDFKEDRILTDTKLSLDSDMKNLLERIIYERNNGLLYSEDLIICYLKEFIIKLVRDIKVENTMHRLDTHIKLNIENSIVKRCIEYIHNNIGSRLTVPEIADSIPISRSYLSRLFKKHMNMTLVDYINSYKLEMSKEYIRSSKYNFTQIADMLGYTSVHYFSNQFKLKYGLSPTQYARAMKL